MDGGRSSGEVGAGRKNLARLVGRLALLGATGCGLNSAPAPLPSDGIADALLRAVWGSQPADVWAVGDAGRIEHWDGHDWWKAPHPGTADLFALSGTSSNDVWAVGNQAILHWEGTRWSASATSGVLYGVFARAPDDVWAVGANWIASPGSVPSDGLLLHFDGRGWDSLNEGPGALQAVWGRSADDVWAGGDQRLLHFDGAGWSEVWTGGTAAAIAGGSSARSILVGGERTDPTTGQAAPLALVCDPTGCTESPNPPPFPIDALFESDPSDVWAIGGSDVNGVACTSALSHFDGASFGDVTVKPYALGGIWGSAADDVWAVGGYETPGDPVAVILHWDGTGWSLAL